MSRGQRLYGRLGGERLELDEEQLAVPASVERESEFYRACSAGGRNPDGYELQQEEAGCGSRTEELKTVSAPSECQSTFATGASWLSGNAQEWTNECVLREGPEVEVGFSCMQRGRAGCSGNVGSYDGANPAVGFRCCSGPKEEAER